MAAAEPQQSTAAVRVVKQPLLHRVVGGRRHESWLPREEVQRRERRVVCVPQHRLQGRMWHVASRFDGSCMIPMLGVDHSKHLQPPLLEVPDCDHACAAARRQQWHSNACTRSARCGHEHEL
jgi:hypothetical protein